MAAAQLDGETQSSLCAEFLNFSAKDTAAVSGSAAGWERESGPWLSPRGGSAAGRPEVAPPRHVFPAAPSYNS